MEINVDKINESYKGWNIRLKVNLSTEELSRLNQDKIDRVEDFKIYLEGSNLFFNCFLNTAEPWEDEPLEELLKAIKFEVEYHAKTLLR
jgi:hypothetical protein